MFGDRSREGVIFGANVGRPIVKSVQYIRVSSISILQMGSLRRSAAYSKITTSFVFLMNDCFCYVSSSSSSSQEIGGELRLRNDLFCDEWDVKAELIESGCPSRRCDVLWRRHCHPRVEVVCRASRRRWPPLTDHVG